ncbi:MAG: GTP-binding protein [Anaerolineales bacterium]|nr:GTP-binding protein [Anaerolineales bacterium]
MALQKKICLLGEFAVGKTSLVERFVYQRFSEQYLSTIGVRIARKTICLTGETDVNLFVWDLAGGEAYTGVQASYLQGSSGALLVCDLTRPETLQILPVYAGQVRSINPQASLYLLANKSDLVTQRRVTDRELTALAGELDADFQLTSAKTGQGVETAFYRLAERILA